MTDSVPEGNDKLVNATGEGPSATGTDSIREEISSWLVSKIASRLLIDPQKIDIYERFNRFGLESVDATGLIAGLSQLVNRKLGPTLAWQYPTIDSLSRYLAGERPSAAGEEFVQADAAEPIAIIGAACRFPGAESLTAFWRLLSNGVDAIREVPSGRWPIDSYFDSDTTVPGKMSTRWGGFLDRVDGFDAKFFGISPREAVVMDPQQRLTLELVWEALEDARIAPSSLKGSASGVFFGSMWNEYSRMCSADPGQITSHSATGQDSSIIAGRISYILGLSGPSLTVNTACSSSLVAVHLACQSLRTGECRIALAGGVNLMLTPESTVAMSKFGAMAPDGRSKAFDARANGYVRGEGAGAVVLKPLSAALADGDPIYCVIRGSAVNNDGFSNGLTAPNPEAQEQVLRTAYARAGVPRARVHYVEAHGTGTLLGDPIEAGALGAVMGEGRTPDTPLIIGSVKTNIGHLEAAAGMAGLLKVVLALRHRAIPASLHFEQPNPHIAFEQLGLAVQKAFGPWPKPDELGLAGVSSFGFGGTNCHVVVEEWPAPHTPLQAETSLDVPTEKLAFVFSGHGSQWLGMGRRLLTEPVFYAKLRECQDAFSPWTDWSLLEVLAADRRGRLSEIAVVQPVLFALQVALAALWQSWGIRPDAVTGHSVGEVAAAHVAGVLTLSDAAHIVCERSRLLQLKSGLGAMAVLDCGPEETGSLLAGWEDSLCIGGVNSPVSTVVSGDPDAMDRFLVSAGEQGVVSHRVNVDVASHSPQFDDVQAELSESLKDVVPLPGTVPVASTVTGSFRDGQEFGAAYWARNLRQPVMFAKSIGSLVQAGYTVFLEISPHPILGRSVQEMLSHLKVEGTVLPSLRRDEGEQAVMRASLLEMRRRVPVRASLAEERPLHLLCLSAKTESALGDFAKAFETYLDANPGESLADVCASANVAGEHFRSRLAVVAKSPKEMQQRLAAARGDEASLGRFSGPSVSAEALKVGFLFTGQGSQYAGMGRGLYEGQPVFRAALDRCDAILRGELERPLLRALYPESAADEGLLERTEYAQPALFAVEYGLAELWRSWGIVPAAVLGHSVGEYAAACVAGVFSLEAGLKLVAARGRLMQGLPAGGQMVAVWASERQVEALLARYRDGVSLAAVNGPESVVVSGAEEAITELVAELTAQGIRTQELRVSHAFHSPLMNPILDEFENAASRVEMSAPKIGLMSNVTGTWVENEVCEPGYWREHVRRPVRFADGMAGLAKSGIDVFVEVGPGSTLLGMGAGCVESGEREWLASLKKGRGDWETLLESLGKLYVRGAAVDWAGLERGYGRRRLHGLPTYAFQRERYWIESVAPAATPVIGEVVHPLLGRRLRSAVPGFEVELSASSPSYLQHHRVHGVAVYPGAAYLEAAQAAAAAVLGAGSYSIEELVLRSALILGDGERRSMQVTVEAGESGGAEVRFFSLAGESAWRLHAQARVSVWEREAQPGEAPVSQPEAIWNRCRREVSGEAHYAAWRERELEYGPSFQGVESLRTGEGEAIARIRLQLGVDAGGYAVHPVLLDSCLQLTGSLLGEGTLVPALVESYREYGKAAEQCWGHAVRRGDTRTLDFKLLDDDGAVIAEMNGVRFETASREAFAAALVNETPNDWLYSVQWKPKPLAAGSRDSEPVNWLVFANGEKSTGDGAGLELAERLRANGHAVYLVESGAQFGALIDGSFRIDPQQQDDFDRLFREAGVQSDRRWGVVYLWSPGNETQRLVPKNFTEAESAACQGVLHLSQSLARLTAGHASRVWLITERTQFVKAGETSELTGSATWGMGRSVALEYPDLHCGLIDLDRNSKNIESLYDQITRADDEDQVAFRDGQRYVARLSRKSAAVRSGNPKGPFQLSIATRGVFENLTLLPAPRRDPAPGEIEIQVHAAGLNFRDVMNALGELPPDTTGLGMECAGTVSAIGPGVDGFQVGDEVVALAWDCFGTYATTRERLTRHKPVKLSFEHAATLPIAFLTAKYACESLGRMTAGCRILIHAASGGVGLAAVQLGLKAGAVVFATAGSDEKRAFVRSLGVEHVMNSRSLDFSHEVMRLTGGEGVDIVLNSLTGEFIPASLAVLRAGGRFIEIGKKKIWDAERVARVNPDVTYAAFALDQMIRDDPEFISEMLGSLVADFAAERLDPLPVHSFPVQDAEKAFRYMAQAKHTGKIALTVGQSAGELRADGTYLITGGLGGLGLLVAGWMVDRGARHVVLVGRSVPSEIAAGTLEELRQRGARVEAMQGDVADLGEMKGIFAEIAQSWLPLRGVIHAAGVFDDGVLSQQTWARFETVLRPKVEGGWNLHVLTEEMQLDFFILFSSVASVMGSAGQANYAAANAFLDGLAHHRRARGLPGLSINWGAWDKVGAAAERKLQGRFGQRGLGMIQPEQGLALLEQHLFDSRQILIAPMQWSKFARTPFLDEVLRNAEPQPRNVKGSILALVREHAGRILGLAPGAVVSAREPLKELGLDSLMAVELRNSLSKALGRPLPASLLFDYPAVEALAAYLERKVLGVGAAVPEQPVFAPRLAELEPVAVIGLGCRFPGAADIESFWELLHEGVDAIREVPADRWDVDEYYDADTDAAGKMTTRWGGFLDGVDGFDAGFFGVSPREASQMDPQQRMALEVSWEALEHAGQAPGGLEGSQTGVFLGMCGNDYGRLMGVAEQGEMYAATGNAYSVAAGRISYLLGLRGPSLAVDTACSSSLVAVHLACQSLRSGESRMALAGGVNLVLSPEVTVNLCKMRMLSPRGRCRTFDAEADGFVRGEGCGMVVLKLLRDAEADGDRVLAVIRGSAVNQDGRSNGLTAPNGPAQEAVIRRALAGTGVSANEVDYVEAHGTGTPLGDPIEVQALAHVLGPGRKDRLPGRQDRLKIGSVKTNVGHLEAAAGIAGLIKVVLSLEREEIPPHLHLGVKNPYIAWEELPVEVATARTPWPRGERRRVAGVSSFGFSGTNAHVVLEEGPQRESRAAEVSDRPVHVLTLSAKTETGLEALRGRYEQWIGGHEDTPLGDAAYTANTGRTHFAHRLAVVGSSAAEVEERLHSGRGLVRGHAASAEPLKVGFLFTGQGSQYAGMGRGLYEGQPVFRAALDRCDSILRGELERPLLRALYPESATDEGLLERTEYAQPALFAVEYGLAELWRSWGIVPGAVVGHSVGEYAAACVAGVFSLEAGLKLVAARGRLMQGLPGGGRMVAVWASERQVEAFLERYRESVSLAAVNGPESVVVSGAGEAIAELVAELASQGIRTQELRVSHAFHSPLMDPILDEFENAASRVEMAAPKISLMSNVTGTWMENDVCAPDYWREHVRCPVRFADGMAGLSRSGIDVFLEIGPGSTLLGLAAGCVESGEREWLASLKKGRGDWETLLESLGKLYVRGAAVDWEGFEQGYGRRRLHGLPTYPFQRERYWIESVRQAASPVVGEVVHPLLGQRMRSAVPGFEVELSATSPTYLQHHRVHGVAVYPGAAYLEAAQAAAVAVLGTGLGTGSYSIEDLVLHTARVLGDGERRSMQVTVEAGEGGGAEVKFFSLESESTWVLHAQTRISHADWKEQPTENPEAIWNRFREELSGEAHYAAWRERDLEYGPSFQGVESLRIGNGEAIARIRLPLGVETDGYAVHPVLLDSCLQMTGSLLNEGTLVPALVESYRVYGKTTAAEKCWGHAVRRGDSRTLDFKLLGEDGAVIAEMSGVRFEAASRDAFAGQAPNDATNDWLYSVQWKPKPLAAGSDGILDELELASFAYIQSAFADLGWVSKPNDHVTLDELANRFGVIPQYRRLLRRLLVMLEEEGVLSRTESGWLVARVPQPAMASRVKSDGTAERVLLDRCGSSLAAILRGEVDSLQLIFAEGGAAAQKLFEDSDSSRGSNRLIQEAIARLMESSPAHDFRILEIGAGTGGATAHILPRLPAGRVDYCFTDVGPLFLKKAAARFAEYAFVHYQALDIEKDPGVQGFEGRQFDIVVAANVLHATADLQQTMANVRKLLKPSGHLVLLELTQRQRWVDLTFGTTDGWWRFADPELRTSYPLLTPDQWRPLFQATGFPNVVAFTGDWKGQTVFAAGRHQSESWVVVGDGKGLGRKLAERFEAAGRRCHWMASDGDFEEIPRGAVGFVHVGSVGDDADPKTGEALSSQKHGCESVLALIGALAAAGTGRSPRLWLVTERAQAAIAGESVRVAHAPVWGLAKVIALEQPDLKTTRVDLDDSGDIDGQSQLLFEEITEGDSEDQVAFRNGKRYVARLAPEALLAGDADIALRGDGTYLITGGLGGLGLLLAGWLVDGGARHVVLVGRSAPSEITAGTLEELRKRGARVEAMRGDVADLGEMKGVFAEIGRTWPPLRGVIHAAGVLNDGLLSQQTWERFETVMRPKVEGGWNLHTLTENMNLDFFLLCSSVASVLGSGGQGNHAAANAFLDGLAHHRRAKGLPGLSINWGAWDKVGAAAERNVKSRLSARGLGMIQPKQGLAAFGRLLSSAVTQVLVAPVSWSKFERTPFLTDVVPAPKAAMSSALLGPGLANGYRGSLVSLVREHAGRILGLAAEAVVSVREPLKELGLDSLMAVELRDSLSKALGRPLPASLLFDYPAVESLATYLEREVLGVAAAVLEQPVLAPRLAELEPVAVIGLGCRFPGAADIDAFWALLREGVDAIREVPADRWDVDKYYDADPDAAGKMTTRWGGFLDSVDGFDAGFFGVSPREASQMDPQQRMALEVSWEALEHAGQAPGGLEGSQTGVFLGMCGNDYGRLMGVAEQGEMYAATGNAYSVAAGRISYLLGLRGPSLAVDTACSSSLVAVHLACQSLRSGESRMALAGGVNLVLSPEVTVNLCKMRMLSPRGRCRTFDAEADGFVRGEGCGMVVLKLLRDAEADGDRVLAVIRGSAVNQDGRSNGLTAPNGPAQEAVIRRALAGTGVSADEVDYVEAHGTGTPLGDPIEVQALAHVLGPGRKDRLPGRQDRLKIGSVKTNIGHLEAAAGIAGLIKVVLSLEREEIPPHLHLGVRNPYIAWEELPVEVATARTPWPRGERRRVAGVSSFGFSGTNAHVVLEEGPQRESRAAEERDRPLHVLTLSAKTETGLEALRGRYEQWIGGHEDAPLGDLAYTANTGRNHFAHRLAVVGGTVAEVQERLHSGRGLMHSLVRGHAAAADPLKVGFLFTGQGSQYAGMGRGLYERQGVFRDALDRCDAILRGELKHPLLRALYPEPVSDEGLLERTEYAQPALFALEYALAELWRSWGIVPAAVLGHSVGEYAAACVAGVFSLEAGLKLVAARGRLMQGLPAGGRMAAVWASEREVEALLARYRDGVSLAAVNGPESVVVSGAGETIAKLVAELTAQGIRTQDLRVSHAFHSPLMDPILDEFENAAEIPYLTPAVDIVSSLTGRLAGPQDLTTSGYWRRHARQPVRFREALEALREECNVLVEIGSTPLLTAMGRESDDEGKALWLPSLWRGAEDWRQISDSLARLYVHGAEIDWTGVDRGYERRKVSLPTYPFERQSYWLRPHSDGERRGARATVPLPGRRVDSPAIKDAVYESDWNQDASLPYVEMVLAGVAEAWGLNAYPDAYSIENVVIPTGAPAMSLPEQKSVRVAQLILRRENSSFEIFTRGEIFTHGGGKESSPWMLSCAGNVQVKEREPHGVHEPVAEVLARCTLKPGAKTSAIHPLWIGEREAVAEIRLLSTGVARGPGHADSNLLSICSQLLAAAQSGGAASESKPGAEPVGFDRFYLTGRLLDAVRAYAVLRQQPGSQEATGDVFLSNDAGEVIATLEGLRLTAGRPRWKDWLYEVAWEAKPHATGSDSASPVARRWLVFADQSGVGRSLAERLEAQGQRCELVFAGDAFEAQRRGDSRGWTYRIDPYRREDFVRLFEECRMTGEGSPGGIVHLWSLDCRTLPQMSVESLEAAQALTCGTVLHLVQQLAGNESLWLVTEGAEPVSAAVEDGNYALTQSPLWGFGRGVRLEFPGLDGGLIDLDGESSITDSGRSDCSAHLLAEIAGPDGEGQVAYRKKQRYVARLVRSKDQPEAEAPAPLDPEGAYLVTGGLGYLGLKVARWLAQRGARHLVLTSRSSLADGASHDAKNDAKNVARLNAIQKSEAIQEIEAMGARVEIAAADAGDRSQMAALMARFGDALPPLRGVVHGAGLVSVCSLDSMDSTTLQAMLRAKVSGTWILHELTRQAKLEFFLLLGSGASVLGSQHRAHYAAANHFLDVFAHHRRAANLPAVTINGGNWGSWEDTEFTSLKGRRSFEQVGLLPMSWEESTAALEHILDGKMAQQMIADIDWEIFKPVYEAKRRSPFLERILLEPPAAYSGTSSRSNGGSNGRSMGGSIAEILRSAEPLKRWSIIAHHVEEEVRHLLEYGPMQPLDKHQGFFAMGMDSLTSVQLKSRLEASLGCRLPATLTFTYPNIEALVDHLASTLFGPKPSELASEAWLNVDNGSEQISEAEAELELMKVLESGGY